MAGIGLFDLGARLLPYLPRYALGDRYRRCFRLDVLLLLQIQSQKPAAVFPDSCLGRYLRLRLHLFDLRLMATVD